MKPEIEEKINAAILKIDEAFMECNELHIMLTKQTTNTAARLSAYDTLDALRNAISCLVKTHNLLQPTIGTTTYQIKKGGRK